MRGRTARSSATLFAALIAAGIGTVAAERERRLDYPRASVRRAQEDPSRPRRELPPGLRLEPKSLDPSANSTRVGVPRNRGTEEGEWRARVVAAALDAADAAIRSAGLATYSRAGFEAGFAEALHDPRIGYVDRAEGERLGRADGEARALGVEIGGAAALERAAHDAERQVVGQFHDLSTIPRRLARKGAPSYDPELPVVPAPDLDDLLAEFPLPEEGEQAAVAWNDAGGAFADWIEEPAASAWYRGLPDETERATFEGVFAEAFTARIAGRFVADLLPAFDTGFASGFDHGRFLRSEHEFRKGFRIGWLEAVELAARDTFDGAYVERYVERYERLFDEWSTQPKLELVEATLDDSNHDGIYEPGEAVAVAYRLANFGGATAREGLELSGGVLEAPESVTVDVAPRSALTSARPLAARISRHVPPRTEARVKLRLGSVAHELPLRIARPLELSREDWTIERHDLDGRIELRVGLRNASRLPVAGRIELTTAARPGLSIERDLGEVGAGETRHVALGVDELDPLALLAGRVALDVELLSSAGVHQDALLCRVPDAARDLRNRDLVLYVVRLARERQADPRKVAAARSLLFTRLREDWNVAASGVGNPYRFDYRNGTATTALGDLVLTWNELEPTSRRHEVFAGLSDEVLELSGRLPGTHPFLRSYVRKLARELP